MASTARLSIDENTFDLPIRTGTHGERAIDISRLRAATGLVTLDDGFANTGSCESGITYINGEECILRYRGVPIEDLAHEASFVETALLLIFGELPTTDEREEFRTLLADNAALHRDMRKHFEGFPVNAHPMSILSSMVGALQAYEVPGIHITDDETFRRAAAALISKTRTIAAASYKSTVGQQVVYPRYDLSYGANLMHMMFSVPYRDYEATPQVVNALNMFLVLHADHELNCSTSTVRMVASAGANLFAAVSAGINALWGPLHGGANVAVIEMLERTRREDWSVEELLARCKDKSTGMRLMGFGHRLYRGMDPRARILKKAAHELLESMQINDPLLGLALEVEDAAAADDYFIERGVYPNVDFYSGIILRALGIPLNMFTVMFAMGRTAGWIAHWKEMNDNPGQRIHRPRQLYVGNDVTPWVPRARR